jgi:hypothetical protein
VILNVAAVMAFDAVTLAIASALHLSGNVHGRGEPFNATHAGMAEAIIAVVLAGGALAMFRFPLRARAIGIALNGLAIVGFLNGLNITAQGGDRPDIAYHLVVLPVLIASLVILLRAKRERRNGLPSDSP